MNKVKADAVLQTILQISESWTLELSAIKNVAATFELKKKKKIGKNTEGRIWSWVLDISWQFFVNKVPQKKKIQIYYLDIQLLLGLKKDFGSVSKIVQNISHNSINFFSFIEFFHIFIQLYHRQQNKWYPQRQVNTFGVPFILLVMVHRKNVSTINSQSKN